MSAIKILSPAIIPRPIDNITDNHFKGFGLALIYRPVV